MDQSLFKALQRGHRNAGREIKPSNFMLYEPPNPPYTLAGVHKPHVYIDKGMRNHQVGGYVLARSSPLQGPVKELHQNAVFLAPWHGKDALPHETEHMLTAQSLGDVLALNAKFDELVNQGQSLSSHQREQFVTDATNAREYLNKKYFLNSGYFSSDTRGDKLHEILADLSALEQRHNIDLTKDPELRKTLFRDKAVRETYSAVTGLRQTRLDARDLPSYTRQPEIDEVKKEPSLWQSIKAMLR